MKARKTWYIFLFISFVATTVLFNNCAPGTSEESSEESNSEQQVELVTDFSGKLTASFSTVYSDGKAYGYALDSMNKTKAIKVIFYANGPVGTGTYVGEVVAKEAGVGANAGHYFTYKLPAPFANGTQQKLWAYGHEARAEYLVKTSPITYVAYTPKAEPYYDANVGPYINTNCTRCHTWNHANLFGGPLMTPTPFNGGTATNNRLIRKLAGLDGHSGGTFCTGGVNSGICANLQVWWAQEFQ